MLIGGTPTVSVKLRVAGLLWALAVRGLDGEGALCAGCAGCWGAREHPGRSRASDRVGKLPDLNVHDQLPPLTPPAVSVWL